MTAGLSIAAPVIYSASPPAALSALVPHDPAGLTDLLNLATFYGYQFITPTPLTHQRLLTNNGSRTGTTLRDIFGWNLSFPESAVTSQMFAAISRAGVLQLCGHLWRSTVRIASIDNDLFLHSAFPTIQNDAVFFGPDTYRFVRFLRQALQQDALVARGRELRVLDVGCGSGAGGMMAARLLASYAEQITLFCNDINPLALQYASINAAHAGLAVQLSPGDALSAVRGEFDLIISNPPFLNDLAQRAYRHGGGELGSALSIRIATEAIGRLAPEGSLILYTGVAMIDAGDPFLAAVSPMLMAANCDWSYEEIDPDVFGEELEQPGYAGVERIAAVGLVVTRRRHPC